MKYARAAGNLNLGSLCLGALYDLAIVAMSKLSLFFSAHSVDDLPPFTVAGVVDYIPKMASKWMPIGIKLDQMDLLKSLQQSSKSDDTKLTEIFMKWDESGNASWQILFDTLSSAGVQLDRVVQEIRQVRKSYCCLSQPWPTC